MFFCFFVKCCIVTEVVPPQPDDEYNLTVDVNSTQLEQKFLNNATDVVEFKAGSQTYSLNFKYMKQSNKQYGTKRNVRRRPRFVSTVEVKASMATKNPSRASFGDIPCHWDKTQVPETGYKRVAVHCSSKEFKEIEALFLKTLKEGIIVKIERIQNKQLWDTYQLKKSHMKNNNKGCDVTEKKLFHGTDNKHVDVICHSNFDWRLCGVHGTSYGKGSYFARDAKYSNHFTSESDVKSMFLSRLLVGEYTEGSPDYVRPPHKDKGGMSLFDSCVDNVANPCIYVIFERQQIYPEYLLQYQLPKTATGGAAAPVAVGGAAAAAAAVAFGGVAAVAATAAVVRAKKAKSTQQSNQNATSTSQVSSIAHKPSTPQQSPMQPCVIA